MKLERINDMLFLHITAKNTISFREEWLGQLRTLTVSDYAVFLRDTLYPSLSVHDRKVWHRSQFSNHELFNAIQDFQ